MQKYSFHTHTIGFDGRNSEEEMLQKAMDIGFEKIGFSNHFIVHPQIKETKFFQAALKLGYDKIYSSYFDEAIEKFENHYKKIDELKKTTGFPIYKGMEVDFFDYDGWRQGFENACKILRPDYLVGSAHLIAYNNTLYNMHDLKKATPIEQDLLLYKYYQNVRKAANSGLFNFLAHLDLPKKVNLGTDEKWVNIEIQTIKSIAKSGTAVELNTSGFKLGYEEPYPSKRIIKLLSEYNIPIILSDDAHNVERIGDKFLETEKLAQSFNIQNFYELPFIKQKYSVMQKYNER